MPWVLMVFHQEHFCLWYRMQVLTGTTNGNFAATIPPVWAREQAWRLTAKQLLADTPGLNNSQRRCDPLGCLWYAGVCLWDKPSFQAPSC